MPNVLFDRGQVSPATARQQALDQAFSHIGQGLQGVERIQETKRQQASKVMQMAAELESKGVTLDDQAYQDIQDVVMKGDTSFWNRKSEVPSEREAFSAQMKEGQESGAFPDQERFFEYYKSKNPNTRMTMNARGEGNDRTVMFDEAAGEARPVGLRGAFREIGESAKASAATRARGEGLKMRKEELAVGEMEKPFPESREAQKLKLQNQYKNEDPLRKAQIGYYGARSKAVLNPPARPASPARGQAAPKGPQYTAAGYAKRVQQAEEIFQELEDKGFNRQSTIERLGTYLPGEGRGSDRLSQDQAERNFVNAVLRPESGAAISPEEFKSAELQYFPRPGDSPDVLAQKRANRLQKFEGLKAQAGGAFEEVPYVSPKGQRAPKIPQITPEDLSQMTREQKIEELYRRQRAAGGR